MTRRGKSSRRAIEALRGRYAHALRQYVLRGGEKELRSGYELGRSALAQDIGVLEIASRHHAALAEMAAGKNGGGDLDRTLHRSGQFLMEALSAYEMRQRAHREAISVLRQLNEVLEQEVKRIAHAVHDEAGQLLVAAHLAIADVLRESSPQRRKQLHHVNRLLDQAHQQLRQLSHELRPTVLDDLGLSPAVEFLARSLSTRTQVPIRLRSTLRGRLSGAVEIGLYRVIQEALTNVAKHAHAQRAEVKLERTPNKLICEVKDDGVGFDPAKVRSKDGRKGLGLTGMKERMDGLGGSLKIRSHPGRGSTLQFSIPLEE